MQAITHAIGRLENHIGLYELVQIPILALLLSAAFLRPALGSRAFARLEGALARIADRPVLATASIFLFVLIGRLALLPVLGTAQPIVPDDGSLLLQASTLAAGRLSNPPLPSNFEAIYVLLNPAFASMYPVLRTLPMALGQMAGIGFWGGLLVCVAAVCALVYWALKAWVPASFAYVTAIIVAIRLGFFSSWINMYYGPAFTALGGLVLLGAYARVRRRPSLTSGALLGLGVLILMTTRPFEGLLAAAPFGVALVIDFFKATDKKPLFAAGAAAGLFVVAGLGLTAAGDRAVAGDWRMSPYNLYVKTAVADPAFFVSPRGDPKFGDVRYVQDRRELDLDIQAYERRGSLKGWLRAEEHRLHSYGVFYLGFALLIPFMVGLYAMRRDPVPLASLGLLLAGLTQVTWDHPQYLSPGFGVVMLCVAAGLAALRRWSPGERPIGLALSRLVPLAVVIGAALPLSSAIAGRPQMLAGLNLLQDNVCCWIRLPSLHGAVDQELAVEPLGQIVAVDSGPRANPHLPVIFNLADPAREHVIWIHDDPQANAQAFARYPGRKAWWLGWRDDGAPCLRPYDAQFGGGASHDERPTGVCTPWTSPLWPAAAGR